eukprot:3821066-Prymnesium_polylepis.1
MWRCPCVGRLWALWRSVRACVCAYARACARACVVCVCVRACVRACARACVACVACVGRGAHHVHRQLEQPCDATEAEEHLPLEVAEPVVVALVAQASPVWLLVLLRAAPTRAHTRVWSQQQQHGSVAAPTHTHTGVRTCGHTHARA